MKEKLSANGEEKQNYCFGNLSPLPLFVQQFSSPLFFQRARAFLTFIQNSFLLHSHFYNSPFSLPLKCTRRPALANFLRLCFILYFLLLSQRYHENDAENAKTMRKSSERGMRAPFAAQHNTMWREY